jgi:hypothetical protein
MTHYIVIYGLLLGIVIAMVVSFIILQSRLSDLRLEHRALLITCRYDAQIEAVFIKVVGHVNDILSLGIHSTRAEEILPSVTRIRILREVFKFNQGMTNSLGEELEKILVQTIPTASVDRVVSKALLGIQNALNEIPSYDMINESQSHKRKEVLNKLKLTLDVTGRYSGCPTYCTI